MQTINGEFTGYVWNGSNLAAETSGNAVTSTYTYGADGITTANINGTTNIYLKNVHGDIVGMTDTAGTIQKTYRYDAFGNEQNPDEADKNPFRYTGEYFDKETDNIYLRNRYYSPNIGRFITEDPIWDGLNWYAYCGNNPVMFVDPWGLANKYVPLRKTMDQLGGSVIWDNNNNHAYAGLNGKTATFYAGDENGSYIKDGTMYVNDDMLYTLLSITFDLGKGWRGRIERDSSGSNDGRKHVHIFKNKESYAQNDDGSPHDGSTGSPPSSVLNNLKKQRGWDWTAKENSWIKKIQVKMDESLTKRIIYPNGKIVIVYPIQYVTGLIQARKTGKKELIEYYNGPTVVGEMPQGASGNIYIPPAMQPVPLPVPIPGPILTPA